jgi:TolA-binding protein
MNQGGVNTLGVLTLGKEMTMMRTLCLAMWMAAVTAWSQNAEVQFAFADSLHQKGEDTFAILEFKRFVFQYPDHPRAPEAFYRLARLYVSHDGDVAGAKEMLGALIGKFRGSAAAREAALFREFIEDNGDFGSEPLKLWMAAESLEKQRQPDQALATYGTLLNSYPKARLADDALLRTGLILRDPLDRPAEALPVLQSLRRTYPNSSLVPRAEFEVAVTLSRFPGREREAMHAFRQFAALYPRDAQAAEAVAQAAALEKRVFVVARQFDPGSVRPYAVRKAGTQANVLLVDIEAPTVRSQRDIQATLEDALIKEGARREASRDQVVITLCVDYPLAYAGDVSWVPGSEPVYRVKPPGPSGHGGPPGPGGIRDRFIDLLKRR